MAQTTFPKNGYRISLERTTHSELMADYVIELRDHEKLHRGRARLFSRGNSPEVELPVIEPWARTFLDNLLGQLARGAEKDGWPHALRRWKAAPTKAEGTIPRFAIFDVDDVILDMDQSRHAAEAALGQVLQGALGDEVGARVRIEVTQEYEILRRQLRAPLGVILADFEALRTRIEFHQRHVLEAGYEVKIFSRETMIALACESLQVPPDPDLVLRGVSAYWDRLGEVSKVYLDAQRLVERLRQAGSSVHLATNSDGFLRYDPSKAGFIYDPVDAAERKWNRMCRALGELSIDRQHVTIGDPAGKPQPAFYQTTLADFARHTPALDPSQTIAIGDSLQSDVAPFLAAGVTHGAWILREGQLPETPDPRIRVVGSLLELLEPAE